MSATITPAQKRALKKAVKNGFIMRPGGFVPENPLDGETAREAPDFDSGIIIDRLVGLRLLKFGEGANQFVPTQAGIEAAARIKAPRKQKIAA